MSASAAILSSTKLRKRKERTHMEKIDYSKLRCAFPPGQRKRVRNNNICLHGHDVGKV